MQRQLVESSSVASIGYDRPTKSLEVEFRNGGVYRYLDVEFDAYQAFLDAESKGRHLNNVIKRRYDYVRVRQSP